jgi:hypothetical protein
VRGFFRLNAWRSILAFYLVKQETLLSQGKHPNREGHDLAAKVIARLFGVE